MYRPVLVSAPTITPVTLAEAKTHCNITTSDDDNLVTGLIDAATTHLDGWTGILGRCLCEQSWRQDFDYFCRDMRLPLFPVISITSIKYDDESAVEKTIDSGNYRLLNDERGAFVRFDRDYAFQATNNEYPVIRIEYVAGYADTDATPAASTVPQAIKHAILLTVGHWYENREAVVVGNSAAAIELPLGAQRLLAPFKRNWF